MALLQVRHSVSTLNALILSLSAIIIISTGPLSVNGFMSSTQDSKGTDPRIKIVLHPLEHVVIPKDSSVLLNCVANYTEDVPVSDANYDADRDMDYLGDMSLPSQSDMDHQYDDPSEIPKHVQYQWLKDDKPIIESNHSFIQTFSNGSIRISYSSKAPGVYRCSAHAPNPEDGAVILRASTVEIAIFEQKAEEISSKAELGSSIVLSCPIQSVPKVTTTWTFNNGTTINFGSSERFFQLNNGNLLIVNVKDEDSQSFRCSSRNDYFNVMKQARHSLSVTNPITTNKATLLSALQNQALFIANGNPLILHCASTGDTSKEKPIRWTFSHRSDDSSIDIPTQKPNELHIAQTSVEKDDGIYKCWLGGESQAFDVTITTPPQIESGFSSIEQPLGFFIRLNCSAVGNPKPQVRWYHNGKPIVYDWIVAYHEPSLVIRTFEQYHKGIYQCLAVNTIGETQVTGLLSMKPKNSPDAPENPECHPLNSTMIKVTFNKKNVWDGITYYIAKKQEPSWSAHYLMESVQSEFNINIMSRYVVKPYEPFVLFLRGMENFGDEEPGSGGKKMVDVSRLSVGIKCATQGLPVSGIFSKNGIFIWWPKPDNLNPTYWIIQFQSDDQVEFKDVVVSTQPISDDTSWDDISDKLKTVSPTTNNYPQNEDDKSSGSKILSELRVDGSVTGILIPNTREIVVRVLVPIIDEHGELSQDTRYVDWKKIRDFSSLAAKFQLYKKESNRVIFRSMDPTIDCVRICYRKSNEKETKCEQIHFDNSLVDTENTLSPFTSYKFNLNACSSSDVGIILYNEFDIQTKRDIPGPVTNQKVYTKNGILIEWSAPTKPNGNLVSYLVEWTIANRTHSKNITYQPESDRNVFKFPDVQESDRFNITIRAVSDFGIGIPVYINLEGVKDIPDENTAHNRTPTRQDPRLGITIGVLLSLLCIFACAFIIVRHRRCSKAAQQHNSMNGNNTRTSFQNSSPLNRSPVTGTTKVVQPSAHIPTNCAMDMTEMQTLIVKANVDTIPVTNGNGLVKNCDNHLNGIVVLQPKVFGHTDDDDNVDMSRCGLISSTPKTKHKPTIVNNDHLKNISTNDFKSHTANSANPSYKLNDGNLIALTADNTTNILANGSLLEMKTTLPPNKSVHSILHNESEIPPTIKKPSDDKPKKAKRTSTSKSITSIPSVFDDSQQSLLLESSTTDSSTGSSGTSAPIERINNKTNCLFDVNSFDNATPHSIVESQRYMRSAALV